MWRRESHARVVHGKRLIHCTARGGGRGWRRDEARIVQVLILFLVLVFLLYAPSQRPLSLWSLINDQSMVSVEKTSTKSRYPTVRGGTRGYPFVSGPLHPGFEANMVRDGTHRREG